MKRSSKYSKAMSQYQKHVRDQKIDDRESGYEDDSIDHHDHDHYDHDCYASTAQHTHSSVHKYCEHKFDRRSRLCNYILDEKCPTCQLPISNDFDHDDHDHFFQEKEPVKSRYMDFYYKHLEEQRQPTYCDYAYVSEPKQSYEKVDTNEYEDEKVEENPPCLTNTAPRPIVAKSRYLDYLKNTEPSESSRKVPVKTSRLDWKDYHRLHTIHKFLDDMHYNHPALCTTGVIGASVENRDLKVLKVSNSKCGNPSVWIDGGIHAREWIAPAVNSYIANYIVENFDSLPSSMADKDWYFLPVMNPDGYEFSHTSYRMWRKNRAWIGHECMGVDLNRNFSFGWGGKGSSDEPKSPFYRGPHPFSEPESRAVRDMLKSSGINFKVYITLHSFGEVIMFPFAFRDELCPDYIRLLEGATIMSKAIYKATGNTYKVGISRDVMYGAAGTSCDWSYGEAKIPFCYLLELRSKKHKFRLPQIEIEETGQEILSCVMALMEYVDDCDVKKDMDNVVSGTSGVSMKESTSQCMSESFAGNSNPSLESNRGYLFKFSKVATLRTPFSQVWAVRFENESQRCFIRTLDTFGAVNIWREARSTMDFFVDGNRAAQVAGMLHEQGIPFSVSIRDVDELKRCEQGSTATVNTNDTMLTDNADEARETDSHTRSAHVIVSAKSRRPNKPLVQCCLPKMGLPGRCMSWNHYHSLLTIYDFMDKMASAYPYLCNVSVIGRSSEGRDIKLLKISNGNPDNQGVWLDSAIHAREWISVAVVTYIANELVQTFHKQPDCVTNKDWYIVPVLNPDGYAYTHTEDRMWRKNRAKYGQCVGVDLNRNFGYGWGEAGEDGSSEDPGSIFYRGPKPFSEAESAAVKKTILEAETEFKVFISFHSYGEVIIFPWGYTGDPCPTYVELLEGGTAMARAIHATNGSTYKVGSTKDLMYFASGTSIDWSYGVANIPYSYMVELPSKKHRFLLPKEKIIGVSTEIFNGLRELMDFVDRRSKRSGPSRTSML